uniref:Uncharacterized protein n=2 Tax=Anguilla anguilla TaxID=7936 RepID=A0A0E9R9U2_ANGAN
MLNQGSSGSGSPLSMLLSCTESWEGSNYLGPFFSS